MTRPSLDDLRRFTLHIVLVEPEIHFNTGNVGRTCLATGAQLHLVEPLGFSLDDARVKRAGLDYWPAVNPVVWESFAAIEGVLGQLGTPRFFSAEATKSYWDESYRGPTVLVFGKESTGLGDEIRTKYRDSLVALPQVPRSVRSVNLSNAVAVAAYEVLRQRRTLPSRLDTHVTPAPPYQANWTPTSPPRKRGPSAEVRSPGAKRRR